MAYYVAWIDSEEAKIFKFQTSGIQKVDLKIKAEEQTASKSGDHHTHQSPKFFHRIAESLKDATELLVVGPGMAKKHFKSHLEEHKHGQLLSKMVGMENMDHPTDKQIVAEAKKFFRNHDLFESIDF